MARSEQVRPLELAAARDHQINGHTVTAAKKSLRRRKYIKYCCICITASVLLLAVIIIVLIFTIFKVKDPIIHMNAIKYTNNNTTPKPGTNMSLSADVSVKNPNAVSFKYSNTTTTLYYHGSVVGEAQGPPGQAKARRTVRMNVTMDLITDILLSDANFSRELGSGILNMSTYSRVPGQVKILSIKRHVVVKMNCTVSVNVSAQAVQYLKCKKKVKL